jgi:SAM-dependent methyltransferase
LSNEDESTGWKGWLEALEGELEEGRDAPWLERVADRVIDNACLRRGESVLDLGAGTGLLTFRAARAVGPEGAVTALDSSPGCLETLERESAVIELQNILPVLGCLESLPFGPGEFDAVVCRSVLVYADDLGVAVSELIRVLAPGGRFSVFEPLAGETAWTGEVSNDFLELERLLKESGGPRGADRDRLRTAFENAGPGELESLPVHFRVSMEGRSEEEILEEYLNDLPGDLSALYILRGQVPESKIMKTVGAFARAAAVGDVKGTLPCLFIRGTGVS